MWLFTLDWWVKSEWEWYLWTSIQHRLKLLREEKLEIVKTKLWIEKISRPSIDICDISDTDSIMRFLARENLDCAFNCEPDTPPSRVLELCMIITWAIPSGTHIHIVPHENTDTAARDKNWSDMFWYFEVWTKDSPQPHSQRISAINRFKVFYLQTLWSSNP
jgi:hypothetical protein